MISRECMRLLLSRSFGTSVFIRGLDACILDCLCDMKRHMMPEVSLPSLCVYYAQRYGLF